MSSGGTKTGAGRPFVSQTTTLTIPTGPTPPIFIAPRGAQSSQSLTIEERTSFDIRGYFRDVGPMIGWIAENCTDYVVEMPHHYAAPDGLFDMTIKLTSADAVQFKLRWSGQ